MYSSEAGLMPPSRSKMTSFIIVRTAKTPGNTRTFQDFFSWRSWRPGGEKSYLIFKLRHADAAVDHARLAVLHLFHLVPERLPEVEIRGDRRAENQDEQIGAFLGELFLILSLGHAGRYFAELFGHQCHAIGQFLAPGFAEAVLVVKGLHRREHILIRISIHKEKPEWTGLTGFTRL